MVIKHILIYGITDNPGGIETYLLNVVNKLDKSQVKFDIISDSKSIAYREMFESYGAKFYFIPTKSSSLVKHINSWRKILKEHDEIDTIYYNALDAGVVVSMLIPWLMKKKMVVHSHNGSTNKKILHALCRPLLCLLTPNYVACSKVAAIYMFGKQRARKSLLIPNPIDIEKYKYNKTRREYLRDQWGIKNRFVVCHIGRITKQKNPYGVIDIFNAFYKKEPQSILFYIGTGEMEKEVKKYAMTKYSINNIWFAGIRNDIEDILHVSDVFILPSFYEGLPISAIEAQASGLPCILSDRISTEAKILPTTILKSLGNNYCESWAQAIMESKKLVRSSNQRLLTMNGYDLKNCSQYYEKLLLILKKS